MLREVEIVVLGLTAKKWECQDTDSGLIASKAMHWLGGFGSFVVSPDSLPRLTFMSKSKWSKGLQTHAWFSFRPWMDA